MSWKRGTTKVSLIVTATVALLVGCIGGVTIREVMVPAMAQGAPPVQLYEYHVINVQQQVGLMPRMESVTELLNRFGEQGWRVSQMSNAIIIFERPRPTASAPPASAPAPRPAPASPPPEGTESPFTEGS